MINKMIKLDRYFFIVCLSIILGITRYYLYDNNDFNLFSLVDKNKKEIKVNLDIIDVVSENLKNYEIPYKQAHFYHENNLAVFIDARNQDEIDKDGQIPNSLIIPVEDIKLIIDGDLDENGECINDRCGYSEALNIDFEDNDLVEFDFPDEIKTLNNLKRLDFDIPYIVYCGSEDCDKSEDLYGYMVEYMDFENVKKYTGGWKDWVKNKVSVK